MTSEEGSLVTTVQKYKGSGGAYFGFTLDGRTAPALTKQLLQAGHKVKGPTLEALLVRLSESGNPVWGEELTFDSERDSCSVRCARKAPLIHLVRRLTRRLATPVRLRRLVRSLPHQDT